MINRFAMLGFVMLFSTAASAQTRHVPDFYIWEAARPSNTSDSKLMTNVIVVDFTGESDQTPGSPNPVARARLAAQQIVTRLEGPEPRDLRRDSICITFFGLGLDNEVCDTQAWAYSPTRFFREQPMDLDHPMDQGGDRMPWIDDTATTGQFPRPRWDDPNDLRTARAYRHPAATRGLHGASPKIVTTLADFGCRF